MDRLDLPNLVRRLPDQLHTSSDGQKFEVRSAVSWRHINLPGEYDFLDKNLRDSVGIRLPKLVN